MKKNIVFILCAVSATIALAVYFVWGHKYFQEKYIAHSIETANFCSEKNDCVVAATSVCPFDCYVVVNKTKEKDIKKLLDGYESRCAYSCVELKGVECVQNKCVVNH